METSEPASSTILQRIRNDCLKLKKPGPRQTNIDRMVAACDAIEQGEAEAPIRAASNSARVTLPLKITPTNIARYCRGMGWSGPSRTYLHRSSNGLIGYINAREEERLLSSPKPRRKPSTQDESFLDEIPSIEVRQFFRLQIERRRAAEQELKLLKYGLKTVPGLDLDALLDPSRIRKTSVAANETSPDASLPAGGLSSLVARLTDFEQLRHLGMKRDRGDILSLGGAIVVSEVEMRTLCEFVGREWTWSEEE